MFNISIVALFLMMFSSTSFSLISKQKWVSQCNNSTGEEQITFIKIRSTITLEISSSFIASCDQAYEEIINVKKLYLNDLEIRDLSPLAGFTNIEKLSLPNNRISDLSPLSGLVNLYRLYISGNQICDLSPLSGLATLTSIYLDDNQVSDLSPLSCLRNLQLIALEENYISDFRPVSQVYIVSGKKQQKKLSLFYKKLMEESTSIFVFLKKLDELSELIEDVHQMKFFYSFVMYSYRIGSIDLEQRNGFIQNGLSRSAKFTSDEDQWTIFRLILDKSREDGVSSREQEIRFDRRGELNNTKNVLFINDLQEAVIANTTAIKGLEGNIQALQKNIDIVNDSLNGLKSSLQRKMAIESSVGFIGSVLNAVSLGFAGSALQAVCAFSMSEIVDFSDFSHVQKIAGNAGFGDAFSYIKKTASETDLAGTIGIGLNLVEGTSEASLEKSVENKNPLVIVAAIAEIAANIKNNQKASNTSSGPVTAQVFSGSQKSTVSSISGFDSGLESNDEDDYPLHAAIKYRDLELLNEELDDNTDFNLIDQKGRSPADFAAIKGYYEMMKLILDKGGRYKIGSKAKMRKICRDKANLNK